MNFGFPKHKIERALIICSGPSAGPIVKAGLPKMPGVTTISINQSIRELPWADYWFSGCYATVLETYCEIKATNHIIALKPQRYDQCKAGKFPFPNMPDDTYIINRCLESKKFVLDGERLCRYDTGFASVNLAIMLGAKRIAMLGYDCTYREWFHEYNINPVNDPAKGTQRKQNHLWDTTAKQMKDLGIQIRNGSPESVCTQWNRCTPEEAVNWIQT